MLYMFSYAADEIHFNLLALVSDRKVLFEKKMAVLEAKKVLAAQKVLLTQTFNSIVQQDFSSDTIFVGWRRAGGNGGQQWVT